VLVGYRPNHPASAEGESNQEGISEILPNIRSAHTRAFSDKRFYLIQDIRGDQTGLFIEESEWARFHGLL
jgi:hypothetical protein